MNAEKTIYKMLTTSTGTHMLDSGGDNGRNWQKNQTKTLKDFQNEPEVRNFDAWELENITDSSDLSPTVSLFHHLNNSLELDAICRAFNARPVKDWDSDAAYGLSVAGEQFLADHGLKIGNTWNSYNGETNLSQVIQGANVHIEENESNFEFPEYILLQIHQGADVRGGYTDAKLFKVSNEYFDTNPTVGGTIDETEVDTSYNGYSLTNDSGQAVECTKNSKIELRI